MEAERQGLGKFMLRFPQKLMPLKRRKPEGMLPEQFYLLKEGDIIRGTKPHSAHRIILRIGKGREGQTCFIELLKLRPSWTNHPNTLYCASDAAHFLPVVVQDSRIWDFDFKTVMLQRNLAYQKRMKQKITDQYQKLLASVKQYEESR